MQKWISVGSYQNSGGRPPTTNSTTTGVLAADAGDDHLCYAFYDGSDWHVQTVDYSPGVGGYASLAPNGMPRISYYDSVNGDLKLATYSRIPLCFWLTQTVDSTEDVGWYTSLVIDESYRPHVSYYDATNYDLKFAWLFCPSFCTWMTKTVDAADNVGAWTSLAYDGAGGRHISYYDDTNDALKYAYYGSSKGTTAAVSAPPKQPTLGRLRRSTAPRTWAGTPLWLLTRSVYPTSAITMTVTTT